MATINWSTLSQGQTIAFDPVADELRFDDPAISAAAVVVSGVGNPGVGPTVLTAGGITVTVQAALSTLSSTNVTFAGGSLFRVGSAGGEILSGGNGNDLLIGLGGNDVLQGGEGVDTAVFLGPMAGYAFGTFSGALVVNDIVPAPLNEGMNTLPGVEAVRFADGVVTVGAAGEFRVNTFTALSQTSPTTAALAGGGFVVSWHSSGQDGAAHGVYAQQYDAAGIAQGAEFRVNSFTADDQSTPSIAALAGGGVVVSWISFDQDGSDNGVYAQRYDAAGAAQGVEFRVNTFTNGSQSFPTTTGLSGGGFVVAWSSDGQDGSGDGVYAQRYDAAGAVQGAEFRVNTFTNAGQSVPTVAGLSNGGFVLAWSSSGQDGSSFGVYAQRYDASGVAQGAEFRANSFTAGAQSSPSIAALTNGGFVVSWQSDGQDGSGTGIYARRYDAAGAAQGAEFLVNTFTLAGQSQPSVAGLESGGFVIAWGSNGQDGNAFGVYAQRYDAAGATQGPEFRVNSYTAGTQAFPSVTALIDGGFVVAWTSDGQDGSEFGVYAQRYTARGEPVAASLLGDGGANVLRWSGTAAVALGGGDGADQLFGSTGSDRLDGGPGDDTLDGGGGADALLGGTGNDFYRVNNLGLTVVDSGGAADYVQSSVDFILPVGVEILQLTGGAINGIGSSQANTMIGNALANTLVGGGGNDTVGGGNGNDTLYGDAGEDQLHGEAGDDWIFGGDDYDLIFGGEGNDLIVGEGGGDIVFGQSGNDLVDGGAGTDILFGQEDNDVIFGDAADDQIIGGPGNDTLLGERGGLSLVGGNDVIYGDTEVLSLVGGDDLINGGGGNDVIIGGGGNDVIDGGHGNDIVEGNAGADILVGSASSVVGPETTGSDLFIYRAMTDAGDSIYGFDIRAGNNDGIDLRPLFDALGYTGNTPRADGFLRVQQSGADARVDVDADGALGGAGFVTMITLVERTAGDITDSLFLFQ